MTIKSNATAKQTKSLLSERDAQTRLPLYFRAPVHGHDPIFSLTRSKLYALDAAGLIKSVSLREKQQKRATRLFVTSSVASYISECAARGEAEAAGATDSKTTQPNAGE